MNLTNEELLQLQFAPELAKEAAAAVDTVEGLYAKGAEMAVAQADEYDNLVKQAAAEAEEAAALEAAQIANFENLDDNEKTAAAHFEKTASGYAAFIEKGLFDTLVKLGGERHSNEFYYVAPYIEEKIAMAGAQAALEKNANKLEAIKTSLKGLAGKAQSAGSYVKNKAQSAANSIKDDYKTLGTSFATAGDKAKAVGRLGAKAAVPAAAAGGAGYLAMRNKKEAGIKDMVAKAKNSSLGQKAMNAGTKAKEHLVSNKGAYSAGAGGAAAGAGGTYLAMKNKKK